MIAISIPSYSFSALMAIAMISLLLVLLVLASPLLSESAVFVSIDCGSSKNYTDENKIEWIGDGSVISNGESHVVKTNKEVDQVMSTLRVFTSKTKNCYDIEAEKGGQVLVRASFLYGNYDGKSSPPSFVLLADGNYWNTVKVRSIDDVTVYEAIYVVKGDYISVCVAQTHPDQLPFISALEVRSVGANIYAHVNSDYALLVNNRVAYGSPNAVRYPDDDYDRIWVIDDEYTTLKNKAPKIDVNLTDNPPVAVLENAATTSISEPLILTTHISTSDEQPIYINMYFSEVTPLNSSDQRSFFFTIDGEIASEPIIPPYGSVLEMYLTNTTATANTTFALVATNDSTLPPLINALEVFIVAGPLTDAATDANDLEGLASLMENFSILQEWTGDPCVPSPFTWDWLNCSDDATPRVTALYLSGYDLSGSIPDFSSLEALETIDMANNSLTGSIPEFLGTLPNLIELNLADNKLNGTIPASLLKNNNLKLDVSGNPALCGSTNLCQRKTTSSKKSDSSKKKSEKLSIVLGAIVSSFFVLL